MYRPSDYIGHHGVDGRTEFPSSHGTWNGLAAATRITLAHESPDHGCHAGHASIELQARCCQT